MSEQEDGKSTEERWLAMSSAPVAVATLVEDDLEDEDWLQLPVAEE